MSRAVAAGEVFEQHTERYDAWFERHPAAYRSELAALRRALPATVTAGLEVGVGTGRFAAPLGLRFGIDPSPSMLRRARARGVSVAGGVGEALPIGAGTHDLVLLVTTICFLDDRERAAEEMRRVLRPGGRAVIGFVDGKSRLGRRYREERSENPFYRGARFVTPAEVRRLLRSHGFGALESYQTLRSGPEELVEPEPVRAGFGDGSFVVAAGVLGAS